MEDVKLQEKDASQSQEQKPTVEELIQTKIKEAQIEFESKYKAEIAGLNKANSKLQKDLEAKELEKLDEKSRAAKEIESAKAEKEKILRETEEIKKQRIIETAIFDAGLPKEFAKRINGSDEDEIVKDVKAFTTYFEAEVNKRIEVEVNKRLGGKAPLNGALPKGKTVTEIQWAAMSPKEQQKFMSEGGSIQS